MTAAPAHPYLASEIEAVLAALPDDGRLVHVRHLEEREARTATTAQPLAPRVLDALGVTELWTHQARAIDLIRSGRSVAIATGTASGKSLCYQVPIVEAALDAVPATALCIFPTKALAQDQLRTFASLDVAGLCAAAYDGDCSAEERSWVRANANVVLTNPEMVHHGLLAHHERWATFLRRLRHVVIDELHVLRGIFGSHVAHVLRRLRRLCDLYGADPTFVFTSATIGEPGALASALCGLDVEAIADDGSSRSERRFVLWNPLAGASPAERSAGVPTAALSPLAAAEVAVDTADDAPDTPRRRSSNSDAALITATLVRHGFRTITFCRSRKMTEVVCAEVRRRLPDDLASKVQPYRAGYLRDERRAVEEKLFSGELRAVVATSALELGIDVGGLDAVVLNGFPGTIASMWQQAGRAGRGTDPAIAVLVAGDDQLDQWLMAHPDAVFDRPAEPAVINPVNPYVLHPHLACAAYELPLASDDERWWPGLVDDAVRELVLDDVLRVRPEHRRRGPGPVAVWAQRGRPGSEVSLRGASSAEVCITDPTGALIGTADVARAPRQVHPGAIYLHHGRTWRVDELDLDARVATVEPCGDHEYTRPSVEVELTILDIDRSEQRSALGLHLGDVRVRSRVVGYRRYEAGTGALLGSEELDLAPQTLETRGFWWTLPAESVEAAGITPDQLPGTLHALEHTAIGILPLFTICDRWDVGGFSTALHLDTGTPTVVIHDAYPGGAGIAELAFERADEVLRAARDVVTSCPCEQGCPSCVQSPKCGNGNEPLDKHGAVALATYLLAAR